MNKLFGFVCCIVMAGAMARTASAEFIQGIVQSVDIDARLMKITTHPSETIPARYLEFSLNGVNLTGVSTFRQIEAGDHVRADVFRSKEGEWQAVDVNIVPTVKAKKVQSVWNMETTRGGAPSNRPGGTADGIIDPDLEMNSAAATDLISSTTDFPKETGQQTGRE